MSKTNRAAIVAANERFLSAQRHVEDLNRLAWPAGTKVEVLLRRDQVNPSAGVVVRHFALDIRVHLSTGLILNVKAEQVLTEPVA